MSETQTLEELKKTHFDWIENKDIYVVNEDKPEIENDDKPIKLDFDNSYINDLNEDCRAILSKSPPYKCHLNFKNSCQTHNCDIKLILPYKYLLKIENNQINEEKFNKIIESYIKDMNRNFSTSYFKFNNTKIEWKDNILNELNNQITDQNGITKNNNIYMLNLHNFLFKKRQEGGATKKDKERQLKIKKILPIFTQALQSDLIDIIMKIMTNFDFFIQTPKYYYYINDNEIICHFFYPNDQIKINKYLLQKKIVNSDKDLHIYLYIDLMKKSFPDYYVRVYFDDNEYKYLYRKNGLTFEEEKEKAIETNKVLFI